MKTPPPGPRFPALFGALALLLLVPAVPAGAGEGIWTPLGPDGGQMRALLVDPADSRIVYAGTNSGVFRSVDGGETWSPSSAGMGAGGRNVAVLALAADPRRAGTIYAATSSLGVFKSVDGGRLWVSASAGLYSEGRRFAIWDLEVDPHAAQRVYAATAAGLFVSANGGATWKPLRMGLPGGSVNALAAEPRSGRLWAGLESGEIYTSADRGATWTASVRRLPGVFALALDPARPGLVVAGTGQGLYRTANRGRRWTRAGAETIPDRVYALAFQPSTGRFYAGFRNGVAFSPDGGLTWQATGSGPADPLVLALAASPEAVYAGTFGGHRLGGVFRSLDGGASWSFRSRGLSALAVLDVAVDPADPGRLYAAVAGLGIFRSTDRGASWVRLDLGPGARASTIHDIEIDPARPATVYAASDSASVLRSDDRGDTWRQIPEPPGFERALWDSLEVDPRSPGGLWAGSPSGFFHIPISDEGATWVRLSLPSEGDFVWIMDIETDPRDPRAVYAAGASIVGLRPARFLPRVFRSLDGGETWERQEVGAELGQVEELAFDPPAPGTPGTLYAAVTDGLYRSTDRGDTWELALAGHVRAVALSAAALYAATALGDVLRSEDGGATWTSIRRGLGWRVVTRLAVDPHDPRRLYAGTETGGVYTFTEPAP